MPARNRLILLLLPATLIACDIDRAVSPTPKTPPTQPSLAAGGCELGVTDAQARSSIAVLIAEITTLETAGTLTSGQANALRGHLENVLRQIDAGKYCPAVAQLEAFREQVGTFEAEGILTPDDASQLTGGATQVITGPPNLVTVDAPSPAAGVYSAGWASFAPEPTVSGVSGSIVLANDGTGSPRLACSPLVGFAPGSIALIERGTCLFAQKALHAQNAGAIAVIIYDNAVYDLPTNMGGVDVGITIPVVSVTRNVGLTIIAAGLPNGGKVSRKP